MADLTLPGLGEISGLVDSFPLSLTSSANSPSPGPLPPVYKWLGLPYATAKRWGRPEPLKPWKSTVKCHEFGNAPWQPRRGFQAVLWDNSPVDRADVIKMDEDCLFLNVFKPGGKNDYSKLPVMVYIYGGGYNSGRADDSLYDPTEMVRNAEAQEKPAIVVTLNYRINIFGFLAHDDLRSVDPKGLSGNYGMYDQLSALRFIKANISVFGGDPDNITLFGESAGGCSVAMHLARRKEKGESEGLFKRAIMQSGTACTLPVKIVNGNYNRYQLLLEMFNITGSTPAERLYQLRKIPAKDLLEFDSNFKRDIVWIPEEEDSAEGIWRWPAAVFEKGDYDPFVTDIMVGWTKDEKTVSALGDNVKLYTPEGTEAYINLVFGATKSEEINEATKLYDFSRVPSTHTATQHPECPGVQFSSDHNAGGPSTWTAEVLSSVPNLTTGRVAKTFVYFFNTTLEGFCGDGKRTLGAHHVLDVPFIMRTTALWKDGDEADLTSRVISGSFVDFALGKGMGAWSEYTNECPKRMEFLTGGETKVTTDWKDDRLGFWSKIFTGFEGLPNPYL